MEIENGKENNEIKKSDDELLKTKNKCGKYSRTLFHIHTPVSHDYRLFKVWNDLSEKEWNKLSVEDYLLEVKKNKLFPEEYFKTIVDEGLQLLELTDEITLLEACRSDVKRYFKD